MANPTAELDPQVLSDLTTLTRRLLAAEQVRYLSARGVWEYYRMTRALEAGLPVHLDNNLLPHYSRAVMREPDLAGVFRTRRVRGIDEVPDELDDGISDKERAQLAEQDAWLQAFGMTGTEDDQ